MKRVRIRRIQESPLHATRKCARPNIFSASLPVLSYYSGARPANASPLVPASRLAPSIGGLRSTPPSAVGRAVGRNVGAHFSAPSLLCVLCDLSVRRLPRPGRGVKSFHLFIFALLQPCPPRYPHIPRGGARCVCVIRFLSCFFWLSSVAALLALSLASPSAPLPPLPAKKPPAPSKSPQELTRPPASLSLL